MRRTAVIILIAITAVTIAYLPILCQADRPAIAEDLATDRTLPVAAISRLNEAGWQKRVGPALGIWVSVGRQKLFGIRGENIEFSYVCSTATRGIGNRAGSYQTPTGWHEISDCIGAGVAPGTIFVERKPIGRIWAGEPTEKDYVLTRILWLRGLEPGLNSGPGIDSRERFIYIHGTPAEEKLGRPASMGCVRLSNRDVVDLFDRVSKGTKVLISEW